MSRFLRDVVSSLRVIVVALVALVVCTAAACGSVRNPSTDAAVATDAGTDDAATDATTPTDAATDAATVPSDAPARSSEVVSGSATVRSSTYTLDLQVGHTFSQTPTAGATHRINGNAAVTP